MDFNSAYVRFREALELAQANASENFDIRDHILSLAQGPVSFGYVEATFSGYGANLANLFPNFRSLEHPSWIDSTDLLILGALTDSEKTSHRGALRALSCARPDTKKFLFEQGFLASTHSWSHAFKSGDPKMACLGYVYDDLAHYYMADYPNRLIRRLNSTDELGGRERKQARKYIDRIVSRQISKYNAQPMDAPALGEGFTQRVLVCDQSFADASTLYGKIDEAGFERMLVAAIQENPDAEIIVKSHPDTSWEKEKRVGYYSHLSSTGRVRILREPVNPFVLFDLVDKVYVGSSQMGLEALFAGKKVVCFGAPFYAGWGLTDDRQRIPHRHRKRSLVDIFHYFYVWYTIYNVPGRPTPSTVDDALDFIEANRPVILRPTDAEVAAHPKVSIIVPVYDVELYIEDCLTSIQRQSLKEIEIITVNDCSPDRSQEIIDRLASEDRRIKPIILTENVGQGFARNAGIEAARGDFIWFIDSDDWMPNPLFLERAYNAALENESDMVRGRRIYRSVDDGRGNSLELVKAGDEKFFGRYVPRTNLASNSDILHSWHFWLWMYRREFLNSNEIRFQLTQMEERPFVIKALANATTLTLLNEDSITYRQRPTSTMRSEGSERKSDLFIKNFELTLTYVESFCDKSEINNSRFALDFTVSQYIHMIFFGGAFAYYRDSATEEKRARFLERIAGTIKKHQFDANLLCETPLALSKRHLNAGSYQLIIAALLSGEFDFIERARALKPIPQNELYEAFLKEPTTSEAIQFQAALNQYARNERAAPGKRSWSLSKPKPRIVIHTGSTKTGSTYLQHLMETNRPALLRAGIWYPEVGLFWQTERPHKQAGHAHFARSATQRDRDLRNYIESGLAHLGDRVHTIIISSEAFFLNERSHELAGYFSDFPVEMIAYLRRQDEWANSQYVEFVSGGAVNRVHDSLENWLEERSTKDRLDYRNHLRRWSERIGVENVTVRVFEKGRLTDNDLLSDFAEAAKLPGIADALPVKSVSENELQLSAPHVELIRSYNARPFRNRAAYFRFIQEVTEKIAAWRLRNNFPTPKPQMLDQAASERILEQYSECNSEIAQTYLGLEGGTLFHSEPRINHEKTALYEEELAIVAAAYDKAAPALEIAAPPPGPKEFARSDPEQRLVNYGLFGWRRWALSPVLRLYVARKSRRKNAPEMLEYFDREPADFIRHTWSKKRPLTSRFLYPNLNVLGPLGVLRLWVNAVRPIIKRLHGKSAARKFKDNPVLYVRQVKSRALRMGGRILFPMGELRNSDAE